MGDQFVGRFDARRDAYHCNHPNLVTLEDLEPRNGCIARRRGDTIKHDSWLGRTWLSPAFRQTYYSHAFTPNSSRPDRTAGAVDLSGASAAYTARSWHSGGVNLVMAEGSGRFIHESIEIDAWRAMSTRAGLEADQSIADSSGR